MSDLVNGRWPQHNPWDVLLGSFSNATQANIPAFSNIPWFGLGPAVDQATSATKKGIFAAVPVEPGVVISKVTHLIGATEGKTVPFSFVALYSGTTNKTEAKLLAQSKVAEAAIKPKKLLTEELETPVLITTTNAPNGYVFAGLVLEATTIETLIGVAFKTAAQESLATLNKTLPEGLGIEAAQKEKSIAAATIKTETAQAVETVPFVILT